MGNCYLPDIFYHGRPLSIQANELGWWLTGPNVPEAWKQTRGQWTSGGAVNRIRWAVFDTGCQYNHPDLLHLGITGSRETADIHLHGTHVAGIIGANPDNHDGSGGVAPGCELIIYRIFDENGRGSFADLADAMHDALYVDKVDGGNFSGGGQKSIPALNTIIDEWWAAGKPFIVSSGNHGGVGSLLEPANNPKTIAVGSLAIGDRLSNYSRGGRRLDVVAPGEKIQSTVPISDHAILSGTSMAAPAVSGYMILAEAKHRQHGEGRTPYKTMEQKRAHLRGMTTDLKGRGFDQGTGWGRPDAGKIVQGIGGSKPGDPDVPEFQETFKIQLTDANIEELKYIKFTKEYGLKPEDIDTEENEATFRWKRRKKLWEREQKKKNRRA